MASGQNPVKFRLKFGRSPLKSCVSEGTAVPWQGPLNPSDPSCVRPHLAGTDEFVLCSSPNNADEGINLVAPYCAIPRDYLSDTPLLRAMGFLVSQHGQLGAIPLPPFLSVSPLESMQSGGAIPPPSKEVSQRYLCNTL